MSFVPVTGPATFRAADPPRDSVVEFTGAERRVELPMRAAVPVLTRARADESAHPSLGLLSGAALLGLQLVAAGRLAPAEEGGHWVSVTGEDDADRVRALAAAHAGGDLDAAAAEGVVRRVLDAVADAMPRSAPLSTPRRRAPVGPRTGRAPAAGGPSGPTRDFQARLARLVDRGAPDVPGPSGPDLAEGPHLVTIALRLEADEEELVAGAVRLVVQVVDVHDDLHVCDAAVLWADSGPDAEHGFGGRARTHVTLALRRAAQAWPVLERLLDLRVPDQLVLDTDEILDLLDHGVAALAAEGFDVLFPRTLQQQAVSSDVVLDRPRTAGAHEEPLQTGLFGAGAAFAFSWRLALHGDPLTPEEMDALAGAATPLVKLRDNWVVVDSRTAQRARRRMIRTVPPAQALAATLSGVADAEGQDHPVVVGASLERLREEVLAASRRDPVPTPAALRAELRGYQRQGLTWLADLTRLGLGGCLADDMGLGKTITLIALHLHRLEEASAPARPTLVVCPASLLGNWEAEIRRFAPGTPVRRYHAQSRDLDGLDADEVLPGSDPGFVLTTYGTMRRDAERLGETRWGLVVADEAQHVKNSRSSTSRALRTIDGDARVALTGTPVENDLTELWSILDWTVPGLLGGRQAFRRRWAAPIEAGVDPALTRRFADLVDPFLLRRRKSDPGVAPELPPKTETDHLVGLTREQVVLYETLVRESMRRIEEADPEGRRGLVLKMLTGLKQICNHPAQYLRQGSARLAGRSEKLDLFDELVTTVLAEDGAMLVFTQYVALGRLLEQHLSQAGIPHQFLHGGTPVGEREEMVRRFQAGPERGGPPVFLLSLRAGGTGLNLTRADHVVHVDRWWNPAVEDQATDRAHRIGQTRPVQVHRMITQGTIEERVATLLAHKRDLADSVLARGETALTELDDEELRDLVSLRGQRP